MWNFITFHLRRLRENQGTSAAASGGAAPARSKKTMQEKAKERKEKKPKKGAASDDAEMGLMQVMVTLTANDSCPEMLETIRRGPLAKPTSEELTLKNQ